MGPSRNTLYRNDWNSTVSGDIGVAGVGGDWTSGNGTKVSGGVITGDPGIGLRATSVASFHRRVWPSGEGDAACLARRDDTDSGDVDDELEDRRQGKLPVHGVSLLADVGRTHPIRPSLEISLKSSSIFDLVEIRFRQEMVVD